MQVREKGGAYGGGASASALGGTFTFSSYRDPRQQETLALLCYTYCGATLTMELLHLLWSCYAYYGAAMLTMEQETLVAFDAAAAWAAAEGSVTARDVEEAPLHSKYRSTAVSVPAS